jgi:type IX secretion system PorP/SprF family membrane protein
MKKYLLTTIALLTIGFGKIFAQQEPQFTHYMFNKLVYNPAAAGEDENYASVGGIYHNQWSDFHKASIDGDYAPITQAGAFEMPIRIASLDKKHQWLGIGVSLVNDKEVFIGSTGILLSGAYHLSPSFGGVLSVGLNAGIMNKNLGPNWKPKDPNDPLLPGAVSDMAFDAGIGVYYSRAKWYAGISALHLPASKLDWKTSNPSAEATYSVDRVYYATGGYTYDIKDNPDYEILPSVLLKSDGVKTSFGATGLFLWKKRFYGGLNFRSENVTAASIMLGWYITPKLVVGYSHDFATQVPTPFGGTDELMFSYKFRISFPVEPPIWDKTPRFL